MLKPLLAALLIACGNAQAATTCPRIVSQSPYLSIALDWLQRGDCVVGVSRYDRRSLPKTGGILDPDGVAIARLKPDLIVASKSADAVTMEMLTPSGAQLLQVDGLESVAGSDAMLQALATASRAPDGDSRIAGLQRARQARIGQIGAHGQRVLVLSACSGSPYSFGRQHYVGDAFAQAGFSVVESAPRIRHLREGAEIDSIGKLVETLRPDIVVSLANASSVSCNAELGSLPVRIVHLRGENFFNPGPRLIDGFKELAEQLQP